MNVEARQPKPEERSEVQNVAEREELNVEARQPKPEERSEVQNVAEREELNVEARQPEPEERSEVQNVAEREELNVEARQPEPEERSLFDDINERREAQRLNAKRNPMISERSPWADERPLNQRGFFPDERSVLLEEMFKRAVPRAEMRREPLTGRRSYIPEAVFERNLYPSMREREYLYERRYPSVYRRREFPPVDRRSFEENAERHLMPM